MAIKRKPKDGYGEGLYIRKTKLFFQNEKIEARDKNSEESD